MKVPATFLLVMACAGCAVGPDYHSPEPSVPAAWSEAPGAAAADPSALARWWTTLKDPLLESLITRAVQSNPDLREAEARVREARALHGVADSARLPSVDATAGATGAQSSQNLDSAVPTGLRTNLYQADFDASWELDLFGGVRRSVEAAEADLAAAEENRRDVLVSLSAELGRNYVELRRAQRQLSLARETLKAYDETYALIKAKTQAGLESGLDLARAEGEIAANRARIPALEQSEHQSVHRLGVLLGLPPDSLQAELAAEAPVPTGPAQVPPGLPSELLRRRPDVRRAERQLAGETARIGVAAADLYPHLTLAGTFGLQSGLPRDLSRSDSRAWTFGPGLTWHLFNAGKTRNAVRAQGERQAQALARYDKAVLEALEEVENTLSAHHREQARRKFLADSVEAKKQALDLANQRFSKGVSAFLDVLDTARTLYDTEDQLAQSEAAVSSDLVALYKALGGGWE